MDILHYIAFSLKGIKNSYHLQMSAMKLQCHLVVLHCTTLLHLYCIIIDMVSRLSQESSKNH